MSVISSGSSLCRRLWIKRICHGIVFSQHRRSGNIAAKQIHRISSQINNQLPPLILPPPLRSTPTASPSFLTPTHTSNTMTRSNDNNKMTNIARKLMEKTIVDQAKNSRVDSMLRSLQELYQSGHIPTIATYNHIIKALAKQFQNERRQLEAHEILDDMARHGILPNSQTYIQLLLGYAIHTSSARTNTASTSTSNEMQMRKLQQLFNGLLQCEQARGFKRTNQKVKKLVEMMASTRHGTMLSMMMMACVNADIWIEVDIWNTALTGCIKGGYMDIAEHLLGIMRRSRGQHEFDTGLVAAVPDVTSYHTVITGYLGREGIRGGAVSINRAVELLQMMMDDGIVADYRIYQDFLHAYASSPTLLNNASNPMQQSQQQHGTSLDTLHRLWQAMMTIMTDGQTIDDNVLAMLLECYLRNKDYSAMEQVYWDLRQHDHSFSRSTVIYFYKAINGFAQRQHLISGIAMFYDLLAWGHGANHSATSSLLRACMLRGQLDIAQQLVDVIEETSQQPISGSHYAMMVGGYVRQGQIELANNMFGKILRFYESDHQRYSQSLAASYRSIIQGYFKVNQLDIAESLLEQYINIQKHQQLNYMMDNRMVQIMVEGYGLVGEMDRLDDFLGRKYVDTIMDSGTRAILIQSRLQHGYVAAAERDLKEGLRYNDVKCLRPSIQAVLSSKAIDGDVASCEYWVDLLSTNHLMTEECYIALLVCYGQAGDVVQLKQAYEDVNKLGLELEDGIRNRIKSFLAGK